MKRNLLFIIFLMAVLSCLALTADVNAAEPDWSKIEGTNILLIYPGQTTWEFLTSDHHPGSIALKDRKASCLDCHEGKEADIAIRSIRHREPTPIVGKEPVKVLSVKAAYDNENAYFWFQWAAKEPGYYRKYLVFNGRDWDVKGGDDRPYNEDKRVPAQYEDRLAMMIDNGKVPDFTMSGCFISCHSDMRKMPNEAKKNEVMEHPYLGKGGLKKSDVRKYILTSRTKHDAKGAWADVKSKEEIEKLKDEGSFLELLQWRASRGNAIGIIDDGYVLEYRHFDSDGKFMESNFDKEKKQPKYVFDEQRLGISSFPYERLKEQKYYFISKDIAVPFATDFAWRQTDAVPETVIFQPKDNTSSTKGTWDRGVWTVVVKRKLNHGNPKEDKLLNPGNLYTAGFAVHDDNTTQRHHYVSLPLTMGFDNPRTNINIVNVEKTNIAAAK